MSVPAVEHPYPSQMMMLHAVRDWKHHCRFYLRAVAVPGMRQHRHDCHRVKKLMLLLLVTGKRLHWLLPAVQSLVFGDAFGNLSNVVL